MKPRALVVEDRPEVAATYARALDKADFEVFIAFNLSQAYEVLAQIPPPDVVFLDLNLNETENAEYTVRQIKKIKSYNPNMVVIVISGILTPELHGIAISQGASACKEKLDMVHQVDLWRTVEEALDKAPEVVQGKLQTPMELMRQLAKNLGLL